MLARNRPFFQPATLRQRMPEKPMHSQSDDVITPRFERRLHFSDTLFSHIHSKSNSIGFVWLLLVICNVGQSLFIIGQVPSSYWFIASRRTITFPSNSPPTISSARYFKNPHIIHTPHLPLAGLTRGFHPLVARCPAIGRHQHWPTQTWLLHDY